MSNYLWLPYGDISTNNSIISSGLHVGTVSYYAGNYAGYLLLDSSNTCKVKVNAFSFTSGGSTYYRMVFGVFLNGTIGSSMYINGHDGPRSYYLYTGGGDVIRRVSVDGNLIAIIGSGLHDASYSLANTILPVYSSLELAAEAMDDGNWSGSELYPITYHYENSTVSGPAEAAVGDTVVVSAIPNNNYGITDAASQILVTNNDVAVEYQWNPSTNTITFTMPDPS